MHTPTTADPVETERRVFIHIPKCGGRALEQWLAEHRCPPGDAEATQLLAQEEDLLHNTLRARGVGWWFPNLICVEHMLQYNACSRAPGSQLGPLFNAFVVRGFDGKLRAIWSAHAVARTFIGHDCFTIVREPTSRLRSAVEYNLSFGASDAAVVSPFPWKWRGIGSPGLLLRTLCGLCFVVLARLVFWLAGLGYMQERVMMAVFWSGLADNWLLYMAQVQWLECVPQLEPHPGSRPSPCYIERRYDLDTEHSRCMGELAAWLRVPATSSDRTCNATPRYRILGPLDRQLLWPAVTPDYEAFGG